MFPFNVFMIDKIIALSGANHNNRTITKTTTGVSASRLLICTTWNNNAPVHFPAWAYVSVSVNDVPLSYDFTKTTLCGCDFGYAIVDCDIKETDTITITSSCNGGTGTHVDSLVISL